MNEPAQLLPAAAIDVGFFSTKYTWGRDHSQAICADQFISELADVLDAKAATREHGFRVAVDAAEYGGNGIYEFFGGRKVKHFLTTSGARAYRPGYAREPSHKALLRIALASIAEKVRARHLKIMNLGVGLPVSNYFDDRSFLQIVCGGVHEIPGAAYDGSDLRVEVLNVHAIPQPAGTLMYLAYGRMPELQRERVAIIDVGGGTADWTLYDKMEQQWPRCGTADIGTLKFARQICESISSGTSDQPAVLMDVDEALQNGAKTVKVNGRVHSLVSYLASAEKLQHLAIAEMLKSIGRLGDLHNVIVTGGGGPRFHTLLQARMKQEKWEGVVYMDDQPVTTNVKGFHVWAELAFRASKGVKAE